MAHVTATWPCADAWHRPPRESAGAQKRGPVCVCMWPRWSWPLPGARKLAELQDGASVAVADGSAGVGIAVSADTQCITQPRDGHGCFPRGSVMARVPMQRDVGGAPRGT